MVCFKQWLVRVSYSSYNAPIVMVRKPDESIRVFVDYKALREYPMKDPFPLPRIDEHFGINYSMPNS